MANGHGGKRPGAGRPRKPLSDKILEDDIKKHKAKVLNFGEEEAQRINPPDYAFHYTAGSKEGGPDVTHLYQDTIDFPQSHWLPSSHQSRIYHGICPAEGPLV